MSVENKEVRNVRKSSRLVAEADEKKKKDEQSRLENDVEESVCPYCFVNLSPLLLNCYWESKNSLDYSYYLLTK